MALAQQLELCGLHTITATESSNAFLVLPYGATLPSFFARIQYFQALLASGSGTLSFSAQVSYNNGANWTTKATGATITLSTTAQNDEQTLQIIPQGWAPIDTGSVWVRVLATVGGSPVGPSVAYRCDIM